MKGLPGKGWPPAGSESCVVAGQPALRSVDSERMSCVIEPRKPELREPSCFITVSAASRCRNGLALRFLRGRRAGRTRKGPCRNLGDPIVSVKRAGRATGKERSRLAGAGARPPVRAKDGRRHGTAERRQRSDAGRAVGSRSAPIVPGKRGNQPKGPRGGKRSVGIRNRWRERSWERRFPGWSQRDYSG